MSKLKYPGIEGNPAENVFFEHLQRTAIVLLVVLVTHPGGCVMPSASMSAAEG